MKTKQLPRRERQKLRQRQEMLEAALVLFSERGYHNVSMHEIAEKAEFAIGTIYNFFQNKEDLYKALVMNQCDNFEEAILRAIEQPDDPVEKLRNLVRTKGELFRDNVRVVRLFLAESKGASFNIKAGLDEGLRQRYYQFLEKLADIFQDGIERNVFKPIAVPYHLAMALDSIIDAFLLLWLERPDQHPFPEDPDSILNIFFSGLINP